MRTNALASHVVARALGLVAACATATALAQAPSPVPQARALIEAKQPARAWDLLAPLEARSAGDPEFDYWLGVAALESGHLERAAIAFERVLVRNPDADAARLDLGRTYLAMGSLDIAAQEFQRLVPRAADDAARQVIAGYLEEIRKRKERQRYAISAFIEVGGGRDNNLSSSTRDFPGAIQSSFGLPGIVATGNSIHRQDNFGAVNGAVEMAYRVAEDRVAFAVAELRWRRYSEFNDYDYLVGNVVVGYQARSAEMVCTATAFAQGFRQDGALVDALDVDAIKNDRNAFGIGFEARRPIDARWSVAVGVQFALGRYPTNPGQDTRLVTMSAAVEHRPEWWPEGTLVARALYAHDDARRPLNAFTDTTASRHTAGLRLTAASEPRGRVSWLAAAGWSRRIDDDPFARASLVRTGRDDLFEAYVQGAIRLRDAWSLQPYFAYAYNRSNIELYTFRKAEGGIALRREFR